MFGRRQERKRAEEGFLKELEAQRQVVQDLVGRYEVEVETGRNAQFAAGKAREERDEYRRVLAAAIATEKRREAQVEDLEQDRQRLQALAEREVRSAASEGARRSELHGQIERLESQLVDELAARERALADGADRAWAEREASRDELVRVVVAHRREVSTALAGMSSQLALHLESARAERAALTRAASDRSADPAGHMDSGSGARGLRGQVLIGCGIVAALVAVALIPAAALSVSDPERALFVHLASGLGPWHLIASVAGCATLAVALLTWAQRDLTATLVVSAPATAPTSSRATEPDGRSAAAVGEHALQRLDLHPVAPPPPSSQAVEQHQPSSEGLNGSAR